MVFSILFIFSKLSLAQTVFADKLASTYSIVAMDSTTGEIGVAVQSHWFSVGSIVSWAESGVGAVATQSFVNPSFGPRGLQLMKSGKTAQQALDMLIEEDEGRDFRQVALIDINGNTATHTGKKCIADAGHVNGNFYSAQANLMYKNTVWDVMKKAFQNTDKPLAERLVATLEAAENEGGDIRGKQSAALLVVRGKPSGNVWEDRLIDLRIEDHPNPVKEMKRLLKVHRAYEHMNAGDVAIEKGDEELALQEYSTAQQMQPENAEMKYWHAVSLVNIGKLEEALPMFRSILLTPRLIAPGLLNVNEKQLAKIMELN
jgi:uncharacterized Ntn-hydrolase superfamily protein